MNVISNGRGNESLRKVRSGWTDIIEDITSFHSSLIQILACSRNTLKPFQPKSDSSNFVPVHDPSMDKNLPQPKGSSSFGCSVFGNCFCCAFGQSGSRSGEVFLKKGPEVSLEKGPDSEWTCAFTLEELYKGTTTRFNIPITIGDKPSTGKLFDVRVKPGTKKGMRGIYKEKGNEFPGCLRSDLVLIVDEKPHTVFKRDGDDLIITLKVSLVDVLAACSDRPLIVTVTTLGGQNWKIPITNMITPNYEEVVPGEGMPVFDDPSRKGNLRIKFDIVIPAGITGEQKDAMVKYLEHSE